MYARMVCKKKIKKYFFDFTSLYYLLCTTHVCFLQKKRVCVTSMFLKQYTQIKKLSL